MFWLLDKPRKQRTVMAASPLAVVWRVAWSWHLVAKHLRLQTLTHQHCIASSTTRSLAFVHPPRALIYRRLISALHGMEHRMFAVIAEPTATIRVQNYAGSWIKSDSCWKCSSGWHAICLCYLYNSKTSSDAERRAGLSVIAEPLVLETMSRIIYQLTVFFQIIHNGIP